MSPSKEMGMSPPKEMGYLRPPSFSPRPENLIFNSQSPESPRKDSLGVSITIQDFDSSCETYFSCNSPSPSNRCVLPEASDAFVQALGNLNAETTVSSNSSAQTTTSLSSQHNTKDSGSSKIKQSEHLPVSRSASPKYLLSASFTNSVISSLRQSRDLSAPDLSVSKEENSLLISRRIDSRRAVSFSGADGVKPRAARRASHCEKHVKWADQSGTNHKLISVRLIRPRINPETSTAEKTEPGQSILRMKGLN